MGHINESSASARLDWVCETVKKAADVVYRADREGREWSLEETRLISLSLGAAYGYLEEIRSTTKGKPT